METEFPDTLPALQEGNSLAKYLEHMFLVSFVLHPVSHVLQNLLVKALPLGAICSQDLKYPPVNPLQSCPFPLHLGCWGYPGVGCWAGAVSWAWLWECSKTTVKALGVFAPECITDLCMRSTLDCCISVGTFKFLFNFCKVTET